MAIRRERDDVRTYRMRAGYFTASLLLGMAALGYGIVMAWQFAHDPTIAGTERFIWIGAAAGVALIGAGAIHQALHTRAVLTSITIELHDLFRTVKLRRDQVAGKYIREADYGISVTRLVPKEEGLHPVVLWSMLRIDGELRAWLESLPDLDLPANRALAGAQAGPAAEERRRRRTEAVIWALLLAFIGGGAFALADGPWDPSQLKQLSGTFAGHREYGDSCFALRLAEHLQSFELCSTSYRNFDRESFLRDIRKGERLVLRVVNEVKLDRTTGEIKYWVEDLRTDDRVYLDLEDIQEQRHTERIAGIAILIACAAGAAFALRRGWRST